MDSAKVQDEPTVTKAEAEGFAKGIFVGIAIFLLVFIVCLVGVFSFFKRRYNKGLGRNIQMDEEDIAQVTRDIRVRFAGPGQDAFAPPPSKQVDDLEEPPVLDPFRMQDLDSYDYDDGHDYDVDDLTSPPVVVDSPPTYVPDTGSYYDAPPPLDTGAYDDVPTVSVALQPHVTPVDHLDDAPPHVAPADHLDDAPPHVTPVDHLDDAPPQEEEAPPQEEPTALPTTVATADSNDEALMDQIIL
jgi:hypothetical protein